jgi:hypothetical protein
MAVVHRKNPQQGRQAPENEYLANDEPLLRYIGPLLRHLRILSFVAVRCKSSQLFRTNFTQNPRSPVNESNGDVTPTIRTIAPGARLMR